MTLIRKLASALCLALLFSSYSNAQVDPSTGNLINYGTIPTDTTSTWKNGVYVNTLCFAAGQPGNCGPLPSIRSGDNINFSYGTADLNQIVNINRALAAGGTGVQLSGFNFSFTAKNGNGWDDGRQDYLAAYVKFYDAAGGLSANYDYSQFTNRRYNWTNFNFNETFANPIAATNYSNAQFGFVGRDNNFWAGNYGPEINNISFSLKYRVDPCALNPAYSPSCSGFSTVSTSGNLVPSPGGYAVYGDSINQSYAINTALANAGSAAQIHGFQWGYVANANGPYCAFWFIACFDNRDPSVTTNVNITNSAGASLYSVTREYRNSYNTTEYSYLFPQSQTMSTLGNFNFTASTNDVAYVGSMWSRALYTADPCAVNPLSSPTCSGYGAAYAKLLSSTSTTSSTTAYAGVTSTTSGSLVETPPTGMIDQTNPQTQQTQQTQQQPQSSPPPQDATQQTAVAQADPSQPAPSGAPSPAGGPAQTQSSSSSSQQQSSSSAGPSKLAMSVLKTSQDKDKATQAAAVQSAAKTLESAMQSSQGSSNMAITMNQDMSANSATAAANFASQTTQASVQVAAQAMQSTQQTTQVGFQVVTQSNKLSVQEQQQQETQQVQTQFGTSFVQNRPQQQQETQQAQTQSSESVVKLLPPQQQDTQQVQVQSTSVAQYQPPVQQEQQQVQSRSSETLVKLLPPQQQEQQVQSQMTASIITMPQSTYTPPQQQQQDTQSTQVSMLKPPTLPVVEVQQSASSGTGLTVSRNMFAYNPLMSSNSSSTSIMSQPQPQMYQPRLDIRQSEVETPQMPVASFSGAGRAGNPLSEIMMQQRFEMMQNNIAPTASSVNRNVQQNDLAGKVDIATMATVPAGFNAYSIVLKDAVFYEPKEVYKNQRTVDNERVLRGLTRGSDSLHQQMVDSQYKLGD